uniref:F-box domain-containing protein n=2 Tax=Triticinae TaxID=1648030 RepID=A0A3B6GZ42_WHEAT
MVQPSIESPSSIPCQPNKALEMDWWHIRPIFDLDDQDCVEMERRIGEFVIMHSPSKRLITSMSKRLAVSNLQGWADLPDDLLHSIVALLGSSLDLLAFAATCRPWRAAFFSHPSKSTLCFSCPPVLIRQNPIQPPSNGHAKPQRFNLVDPSNTGTNYRCQIREEILQKFYFAGSSYGQLIFFRHRCCLVVDAFSGAEVSPPCLPELNHNVFESYYCSTLTAPLASPNSRLLASTKSSLFDWPVGSDSWSELKLSNVQVRQIVELNGQFIAMDDHMKIYTLQLAPQLGLQDLPIEWCGGKIPSMDSKPFLVVCRDMLLMVCYSLVSLFRGSSFCTLHRLDMSTNPAKWVEMKKLDNWALFVAADIRTPPFSCVNPERWGGRSNCLYYTHHSEPWGVRWLGNEPDLLKDPSASRDLVFGRNMWRYPQSLWVYPSMFYSDRK